MRFVSPTFWSRKWAFSTPFSPLVRCFIHISKWSTSTRKPHKTSLLRALPLFRLLLFLLGYPAGASAEERDTRRKATGRYAIFIKYALINLDEITLSRNILAFLFSFGLTNYLFHRIPVCARQDLLDLPDEMGWMDIMGYQAATVGTVPKARRAWQVRKGHVVSKEKRVRRVWQVPMDHVVLKVKREKSLLNKETGNSARGKRVTTVILALFRWAAGKYRFLYSDLVIEIQINACQNNLPVLRSPLPVFLPLIRLNRVFLDKTFLSYVWLFFK